MSSIEELAEVIVKYSGDIAAVKEAEAAVELLGDGYAIMTLRKGRIPLLYNYSEIQCIEVPKTVAPSLKQSLRQSCVPPVHHGEGYNLKGKGVIVAIIDSGIDFAHSDFRDDSGKSRILYLWDQSIQGTPPRGFAHGTEYSQKDIDDALAGTNPYEIVASRDTLGHGTAVAAVAAGNGRAQGGRERGVAPEASLIVVKLGHVRDLFPMTTQVMRGIKYVLDKAWELRMPVAVNLSLGSNDGSHDGSSLFETYIDSAAERWKNVIVAASGNEGGGGSHYFGRIASFSTDKADFWVSQRLNTFYITFWKDFADDMALSLTLPSGKTTEYIGPRPLEEARIIDGVNIEIYYNKPTHYNKDQGILFVITGEIPQGIWSVSVRSGEIVNGIFNMWLPTREEAAGVAFAKPAAQTTLTLPSTAKKVITVGGYDGATFAAAYFSGRGFTRNNVYAKPDISAPAVGVISARPGGGYGAFEGTSIAAPFVTGAAAIMMEWGIVLGNNPLLYGQQVKAYLAKGAKRPPGVSYPSPIWGYGALCLKNSMDLFM